MKVNVMSSAVKEALVFFGFGIAERVSGKDVKKAYLRKAFELHPDRNGDNGSMQLANQHFSILREEGLDSFEMVEDDCDWLHELNEGHPLYNSRVPAFKTRKGLLSEQFSIRDDRADVPGVHVTGSRRVYFQNDERDYKLSWSSGGYSMAYRIADVTEAGRAGKSIVEYSFAVEHWGREWENSQIFANLLLELPGLAALENSGNFCWSDIYQTLAQKLEPYVGDTSVTEVSVDLWGVTFTSKTDRYSDDIGHEWKCTIGGSVLKIYRRTEKGIRVFSPFSLNIYKRVSAEEWQKRARGRVSTKLMLRLLINGQFFRLKRDYRYTDDYYGDACSGFGERMIENPFSIVEDWISNKYQGALIYSDMRDGYHRVSFGRHMNESCSFYVDLDGGYPLVDLTHSGQIAQSLQVA